MPLRWKHLLAIGLLQVWIVGCPSNKTVSQKDVKAENIVEIYSVTYDGSRAELAFSAQFRNGGLNADTIQLNRDEYITIGGQELHLRHGDDKIFSDGTDYHFRTSRNENDLANSYTFTWHKKDGSELQRAIKLPHIGIPQKSDQLTISRSGEVRFALDGYRFDPEDNILGTIGGSETSTFLSSTDIEGHELVFRSDDINKLWLGKAFLTLSIDRETTASSANGQPTMVLQSSYRTAAIPITIVE